MSFLKGTEGTLLLLAVFSYLPFACPTFGFSLHDVVVDVRFCPLPHPSPPSFFRTIDLFLPPFTLLRFSSHPFLYLFVFSLYFFLVFGLWEGSGPQCFLYSVPVSLRRDVEPQVDDPQPRGRGGRAESGVLKRNKLSNTYSYSFLFRTSGEKKGWIVVKYRLVNTEQGEKKPIKPQLMYPLVSTVNNFSANRNKSIGFFGDVSYSWRYVALDWKCDTSHLLTACNYFQLFTFRSIKSFSRTEKTLYPII